MKNVSLLSLGLFLAICFVAIPVSAKGPTPTAIVYEVAGKKKLDYRKGGRGKWTFIKKKALGLIGDHFRTGADTTAALDLSVGGRIGLKKNSEVVLASQRERRAVVDGEVKEIRLLKGGIWAKFGRQQGRLNIRTSGGVLGIKGTEFTIDSSGGPGQTKITLLEGEVDYQDNDGVVYQLRPGQKLSQFFKDGQLQVLTGLPSEVDKAVESIQNDKISIGQLKKLQSKLDKGFLAFTGLEHRISLGRIAKLRSAILKRDFPTLGPKLSNPFRDFRRY